MNVDINKKGVIFKRSTGEHTALQWFGPGIIRVKVWKGDKEPKDFSFARVAEPNGDFEWNFTTVPNENSVLSSDILSVVIDKDTADLSFYSSDENKMFEEKKGTLSLFENDLPNEEDRQSGQITFNLPEKTGIFGLGQFPYGDLNWRNKKATLVQGNTVIVNPFILSSDNWGILWDNPSHTEFEDNQEGMKLYSEVADCLDYFVCIGKNADDVLAGYRHLTGQAPLFGKWAYGFWQCRERYGSANELVSIVEKYRELGLPMDNIVQDWMYWGGNEHWSSLTYNKEFYGDLEEAIKKIHNMHAKVMMSIWPILGDETEICKEMEAIDCMFDTRIWNGQRNYDAFNDEAREIYWRYLKKGLFDIGADAWWMDSTEPEFRDCHNPLSNKAGMMDDGKKTAAGSWNRVLNAYGLYSTKGVYEGQRSVTDEKRVFILSRSAFAGQQRFATVSWSGDIGGSWKIFREQIPAGLNFCMSGIPYWTTDNGGFHISGMGAEFPRALKDPAFKEFFLRWFQWSVFCPIMRTHGTGTPREIWEFGDKGEKIRDSMEAFDNLRYRLLPYIYSMAADVTFKGYTMMRGLAMDFPKETALYDVKDQYMFGPAFMVCPVTEALYDLPVTEVDIIQSNHFIDTNGEPGGLTETYFDDEELEKEVNTAKTGTIDKNWAGGGPAGVTGKVYSARYEGKLVTGDRASDGLILRADNKTRVWIDGEQIGHNWFPGVLRDCIMEFPLEANKEYDIKIEYSHQDWGGNSIQLGWFVVNLPNEDSDSIPKSRPVILPKTNWIDFWTGETLEGGKEIEANATLDVMPLYVKAGSIIPMGPYIEWYNQKDPQPLELRIYPGADTEFTLYEDEGDNYNYEKGVYSTINFKWNDAAKTLNISDREGSFPGMLKKRTFNVVIVKPEQGTGIDICEKVDSEVEYSGSALSVKL